MNESDIKIKKLNLPVEGMTCASCVARVEKAISKVEGVKNVSVNFATEKASFEIDPDRVDMAKITEVVEEAGYKISISDSSKMDGETDTEIYGSEATISEYEKQLKKDFVFGIILTIPIFLLSMGSMWESFSNALPFSIDQLNRILLILTTTVIFISGKRFFIIFWNNLKHFAADMN